MRKVVFRGFKKQTLWDGGDPTHNPTLSVCDELGMRLKKIYFSYQYDLLFGFVQA